MVSRTAAAAPGPHADEIEASQRRWRYRIFALTWLAYAGFYLCRKNLAVVMPLLESERGFQTWQLAHIVFFYNLFYMIGQFANGLFSDRWGPRLVVGTGLAISVMANVFMGTASALAIFIVLAAVNGYGQSTGWSGTIKNMSTWFDHGERGVVMGWWSTCYVIGGILGSALATWAVTSPTVLPTLGSTRAFWFPAIALGAVALIYVRYTRNQPSDVGLPDFPDSEQRPPPTDVAQLAKGEGVVDVRLVLKNPAVWITAAMYFCVKLTRYSFLFWLPYYMTHALGYSEQRAGYTSSVYEFAGFFGVIAAGYLSDKVFHSRRFPVGSLMLFGLAGACLIEPTLAAFGFWGTVLGIALIGMMTYGPDSLMSAAAAMDMGTQRGAATAAGVINSLGSAGQLVSSYLVAYVSETWGWNSLFYLFVAFALTGAILLATKWNYGGRGTAVGIAQPEAMKGGVPSI